MSKIYDEFTNVYMRGLEDGLELAKRYPGNVDSFMHNIRERRSKRIKMQFCNSISNHAVEDDHPDILSVTPEGTPE